MNFRLLFTLLIFTFFCVNTMAQTSKWKSYLSYFEPKQIEEAPGNMIYVLASDGLYSYDKDDQSLRTYDKINVLNDCGIEHIAWCQAAKKLVIVYQNNNIDLLSQNDEIINIADYKNKSMTADKSVNNIDISGYDAFLSTGFGIIRLNVAKAEISNTYQLGFKVDYSYVDGTNLYAASSTNGLYSGKMTDNLLDKANWKRVGEFVPRYKTMDPQLLSLVKTLSPGGPKYNYFGFLKFHQGNLYSCGGKSEQIKKGCIQLLNDKGWTIFQDEEVSQITGVKYEDIYCLDINPKNPNHLMAGGRNGLYEYNDGKFTAFYNHTNSPIEIFDKKDKEYELVNGVLFDKNSNLWLLNSQAPTQSLLCFTADRQWQSHSKKELMKLNDKGFVNKSLGQLEDMMTDSRGLIWFVNNHWTIPSLYFYQIENDALKPFTSFINEDGTSLVLTAVRCVAEDKNNNIWVGTNMGPIYLNPSQITSDSPVFTQVKVPRNDGTNFADYLLSGVDISCIAIDQANRKWFGTHGNGVYLISADNMSEIEHFTSENSPLFSNNIEAIAINETTGEVFFGTDRGLCSYMSNALTAGETMTKDNVYAYPNPVRPDYNGAITITGLSENADVKIVTSNGALVYEGRATGGKYKWYGLDKSGHRVASGIYMVEVATQEGEKGVVCKIAIIR